MSDKSTLYITDLILTDGVYQFKSTANNDDFYNGHHHYGTYLGGLICEWENPDELEKVCSMSKKSYSEVSKAMSYLDLYLKKFEISKKE